MKSITLLCALVFCCFTTYQGVSQTFMYVDAKTDTPTDEKSISDNHSDLVPTNTCDAIPNIVGFNYPDCKCAPGSYPVTEVREGITVIIGCQTCPAGSYCPDGINKFDCPAGSFSSTTGSTVCASCPAGTFSSITGSTVCASCPAGSFSSTTGSTVCASCPAGTFSSITGSTVCASCPAGSFSSTTGSTVCASCPAGSFSNVVGSTVCASCPAGSFSSVTGSTVCASCPAGSFSNVVGSTVCASCPAGSFSSIVGSTVCASCPAGSFSNVVGSTVCASCPAGSFSSTVGSTVCASCPAGSFSSTVGSTVCASCPAGSFSSTTGSTVCASCPAGSFSSTIGSTVCASCPAGSFSSTIGSTVCASCPAGTFSNTIGSTVCTSCNSSLSVTARTGKIACNGGTTTVTVTATGGTAPYTGTGSFTKSAGTYTFIVKDASGCTASASITVSQNPPIEVHLPECKYVYYGYGNNCTTLTATATGGGGTYTFRWNSGTISAATLNVCPTKTTEYEVTVTDQYGCKEDEDVTVQVIDVRCGNKNDKVQICHNGNVLCVSPNAIPAHLAHGDKLGTCGAVPCSSNENASMALHTNKPTNFTVYPNPAHNEAWVNLTSFEGQAVTLIVTDILGKTIQQTVIPQASSEPQRLDTALLPNGLYFIKIQTTENLLMVHKLQITK